MTTPTVDTSALVASMQAKANQDAPGVPAEAVALVERPDAPEPKQWTGFVPFGNRVVLRLIEERKETASGLVIPDVAQEHPQTGEVLAVGPKCEQAVVGDTVLFSRYAGMQVELDGEPFAVLTEDDLTMKLL